MTAGGSGIVIDASVARAAGESEHPVSSACRRFLEKAREGSLDLVMTDPLLQEWKRHRSVWSARWLATMIGRKRWKRLSGTDRPDLRSALDRCARQQGQDPSQAANIADAVRKDVLLVEASLAAGEAPIASNDDRMRRYLSACAVRVKALGPIVWVNPTRSAETPLDWLAAGGPREPHRTLGAGNADRDRSM